MKKKARVSPRLQPKTTRSMCPICKKARAPRAENKAFPFCSNRCQMVDLSNWLDGNYKIADDVGEFSDRSAPQAQPDPPTFDE